MAQYESKIQEYIMAQCDAELNKRLTRYGLYVALLFAVCAVAYMAHNHDAATRQLNDQLTQQLNDQLFLRNKQIHEELKEQLSLRDKQLRRLKKQLSLSDKQIYEIKEQLNVYVTTGIYAVLSFVGKWLRSVL